MEATTRKGWTTRVGDWFDERFDVRIPLEAFLKKPVPKHAIRWYFCLGGITFSLFVIQGVTGILLSLYYKPTPEQAYDSILFIMNNVRFGWLIRSIHSWSASLDDRLLRRAHAARLHHRLVQEAARAELGGRVSCSCC